MSLAYSGESSVLSDIVERDPFLEALNDQALRVRILEKEPKNLSSIELGTKPFRYKTISVQRKTNSVQNDQLGTK